MNQLAPIKSFRDELTRMADQFRAALPAHMPVAKFQRVVITAIQTAPDLARCERSSLWNACMRAAQDGLLPDGREGAIIPYRNKAGHLIAQWLPMIAGLRKKARNSGEIATWDVQAVYERDEFEFEQGDTPFIKHKPFLGDERGKLKAVYSVATLRTGEKSREVMSVAEVEKIRAHSRAKGGPWSDFYEEMAKKTVARRHSKVLPMSSDLDELVRRDDTLYEIGNPPPRPKLADFSDDDGLSFADAHQSGIEARDAGKVIDPPADLPAELHDAYREGWRSRDDELRMREGDEDERGQAAV